MLDKNAENLKEAGVETEGKRQVMLGDANYYSKNNLALCEKRGIDAVIPDSQAKKQVCPDGSKRFGISDFKYNEEEDYYECPRGKRLEYKRMAKQSGGEGKAYRACLADCKVCPDFSKCSWSKTEQSKIERGKTLLLIRGVGS